MNDRYSIVISDAIIHDYSDSVPQNELGALVASGDCFVTLATQLDAVSHQLPSGPDREVLESVVRTLMELQRRYRISAKPHDYRQ